MVELSELTPKARLDRVNERIDFYMTHGEEKYPIAGNYWHIFANWIDDARGRIMGYDSGENPRGLRGAEEVIAELDTYFDLIERFPTFRRDELDSEKQKGGAFPELSGPDYINSCRDRLEGKHHTKSLRKEAEELLQIRRETCFPEDAYVAYITHNIGNSMGPKSVGNFKQARINFFDELSLDAEISPLSQIALASTIGAFYQSEEVKEWLKNPSNEGKEYDALSKHYKSKVTPRLREIAREAHKKN